MGNVFWNPKLAEHEIMGNAMKRLEEVAQMMTEELKKAISAKVPDPGAKEKNISRPVYKKGKNKGKWWTGREAGRLLEETVRYQMRYEDGYRSAWVMVGNTEAYYGKIWEYKHKPFFRPTINRSKPKAKRILEGK